jgi:Uma2 family endonuclease
VEVVSPDDSLAALTRKAQRYLDAGSRLVWVVDPQRRRATVHRPDGTTAMLPTEGALPGEDVLPGLEVPLATLFD